MKPESIELAGLFISAISSATILPGTSETVFGVLLIKGHPWLACLLVASIGNWIGGMSTYALGRLGKWSWLNRIGIKESEIGNLHLGIQTWGSLAALVGWVPLIGDVLMVALGYFRANLAMVAIVSLIGRFLRYAVIAAITLKLID